jgi:Fe-S oxidoreductase
LLTGAGYDFRKADYETSCCGFGGTYSLKFPEISKAQLNKKLNAVVSTGAEILVTECPGCIMQLRGVQIKQK